MKPKKHGLSSSFMVYGSDMIDIVGCFVSIYLSMISYHFISHRTRVFYCMSLGRSHGVVLPGPTLLRAVVKAWIILLLLLL